MRHVVHKAYVEIVIVDKQGTEVRVRAEVGVVVTADVDGPVLSRNRHMVIPTVYLPANEWDT